MPSTFGKKVSVNRAIRIKNQKAGVRISGVQEFRSQEFRSQEFRRKNHRNFSL